MISIHVLPILILYQVVKWLGYPVTQTVRWTWRREDIPWHHGAVPIMFWFAFVEMFAMPAELVRWSWGIWARTSRLAYATLEPSRYRRADEMVELLVGRRWRREILPASLRWLRDSYRLRSYELDPDLILANASDHRNWKRVVHAGRAYLVRTDPTAWAGAIVHLGGRAGRRLRVESRPGVILVTGMREGRALNQYEILTEEGGA